MRSSVERAVERRFDQAMRSLREFLSIASVSAQGRGMGEAARYLQALLASLGAEAAIVETAGYPAVIGSFGSPATAGVPTLLLYGHYDVQPEDPLELWTSPPFVPTVRDGVIYARGATDDKGNIMAALFGVAVARELGEPVPHVKFCFEGEEEIGSRNLGALLRSERARLAADACVLCDRGIHERGSAQIYLGNKGMVSVQLRATGPVRDVHSSQAPLIPNAARLLMEVIQAVGTARGAVAGARIGAMARGPNAMERQLLQALPLDRAAYAADYGLDEHSLVIEPGVDAQQWYERLLFRPTVNVQGFHAGYGGPGNKTIIPALAEARLDIRLSPGMEREQTARAARLAFGDAASRLKLASDWLQVEVHADMDPYVAPVDHPAVQAAIAAGADVYPGSPVVWPLVDGSGPLAAFAQCIGGPAFLIGLGNPFQTANTHAPDENLHIDTYRRGIAMLAEFLLRYAARQAGADRPLR